MSELPPPPPPPARRPPSPPSSAWSPIDAPLPPPSVGAPHDPWASLPPLPPLSPKEPRRRWLAPLGIGIVVLLVAGLFAAASRAFDDGPAHPDEWDPRVADLAAFVEDERGLEFDHPVYVDFLTADEYSAAVTDDTDAPPEDVLRADYASYAGQLRALGVASGELDLYEAFNQVVDSGTLAFYDPDDDRVRVRGTEMSVGTEVTVVHELTHALQDQHFDLERLDDPLLDIGASMAFRSVGEGDAMRVEGVYVDDELTDAERADYDEEYAQQLADSEQATAEVPPYVDAQFGAPYALGQPFVTMLFNQDGNDGVNGAFKVPPFTEEHVFDPASFLDEEGADVIDLDLPEDVEVTEQGPFGATAWYLFLAERIDPKVAFEAALGWGGDVFAAYEQDDVVCLQAIFAGDTDEDEDEMRAALDAWEEAMPGGQADTPEIDGRPAVQACDPGEDVDLELTDRSENALYVPNLWGYLIADAATALDADGARCYARAVLDDLTFDDITDPESEVLAGDAFQRAIDAAFARCS